MLALGVTSFALVLLALCVFAAPVGHCLGVIDHPDGGRKHHSRPTPLVGGVALMAPLSVAALMMAFYDSGPMQTYAVLALAGFGFMLLGLIDDRRHLAPYRRLLISILFTGGLMAVEPRLIIGHLDFGSAGFGFGLGFFAVPFTIICVVGLMNAINMVDGKNGLLLGLSIFWASCLLLSAPESLVLYLLLFLLGALLIMPFNWLGRLFMGDAGSYAIGAVIALLMIYAYNVPGTGVHAGHIVLWLLVPVLDCIRLMVLRSAAGQSPMAADANHLHHRLCRIWPWPQAFIIYMTLAAGPGLLASIVPELTLMLIPVATVAYGLLMLATREPIDAHPFASSRS